MNRKREIVGRKGEQWEMLQRSGNGSCKSMNRSQIERERGAKRRTVAERDRERT